MDDLILVESSQAGNKAAFDSLIDRYYKSIYCFAFQYAGSHHEADEVCQEAFLRAFEKIRTLKDGNCFRGWILAIASNLLRKRTKQLKREKQFNHESTSNAIETLTDDSRKEPFEALSAKEKATRIHEQLQEMPEYLRLVTILILMENLSQKDAAVALGCSEASICRHLDLAREWLRARLKNVI